MWFGIEIELLLSQITINFLFWDTHGFFWAHKLHQGYVQFDNIIPIWQFPNVYPIEGLLKVQLLSFENNENKPNAVRQHIEQGRVKFGGIFGFGEAFGL